MPVEIERKYLVNNLEFIQDTNSSRITQGYIFADDSRVFRVRITDSSATLTIKKKISQMERLEYEYPIPLDHAKEIIHRICEGKVIEKIRYYYRYKGKTWEIDKFLGNNRGLIIAEIELTRSDETFGLPSFIGDEVTSDPRYINSYLINHPYSEWGGGI
ncbi:MAG: CYTH domain-containing protein [Fidelibacterota bacterium]